MNSTPKNYPHEDGMTWKGDPRYHQEQMALALIESGVRVFAWSWATVQCDEAMCIQPGHLQVNHAERLEYPSGICVYCGAGTTQRDHLLPSTFTGLTERRNVLTVPACAECNVFLGDSLTWAIDERRILVKKRIRSRHKRKLNYQTLTEAELREYGPGLRPAMRHASDERREIEARLEWPKDPTYDIRYLQKSGIDDPWAFGMLAHSAMVDA